MKRGGVLIPALFLFKAYEKNSLLLFIRLPSGLAHKFLIIKP